ncbi:MAG: ATP-dependent sacrificial sulfur transferase LarE [FCB group bacterium]|jgi:uncharacterized protein|nr:ATP-dependent sacrificial sulfur transferase LarE [FCB group bacterium]
MSDTALSLDLLLEKEARLKTILTEYGAVAVAYSGGVDSTYLADVSHEALGEKAVMVLADSPSIPRAEVAEAMSIARERGWNLHVVRTREFENEDYLKNDGNRCYFCKSELFEKMREFALSNEVGVLAYGAITDDLLDQTRVGHKAAQEYAVVAPLQEAQLSKTEVRALSRRRKLSTADKASFACLASRFPKGTRVSVSEVEKVEKAEEVLRAEGFHQFRARHHGDICRVEIDPRDFGRLLDPETRDRIVQAIRAAGYRFVALDLAGYRTGSTAG